MNTEKLGYKERLQRLEKRIITRALNRCGWNRSHAAQFLGMNRTMLVEKMRRFGFKLNPPHASGVDTKYHRCHTFTVKDGLDYCVYCNEKRMK